MPEMLTQPKKEKKSLLPRHRDEPGDSRLLPPLLLGNDL